VVSCRGALALPRVGNRDSFLKFSEADVVFEGPPARADGLPLFVDRPLLGIEQGLLKIKTGFFSGDEFSLSRDKWVHHFLYYY